MQNDVESIVEHMKWNHNAVHWLMLIKLTTFNNIQAQKITVRHQVVKFLV